MLERMLEVDIEDINGGMLEVDFDEIDGVGVLSEELEELVLETAARTVDDLETSVITVSVEKG